MKRDGNWSTHHGLLQPTGEDASHADLHVRCRAVSHLRIAIGQATQVQVRRGAPAPSLAAAGAPVSRPGVRSLRSTLTSLPLITAPVSVHRKTKIVATMGPKCWSREMLSSLIDAGVDIIRLNFRWAPEYSALASCQDD
jgi:hypothetical protein